MQVYQKDSHRPVSFAPKPLPWSDGSVLSSIGEATKRPTKDHRLADGLPQSLKRLHAPVPDPLNQATHPYDIHVPNVLHKNKFWCDVIDFHSGSSMRQPLDGRQADAQSRNASTSAAARAFYTVCVALHSLCLCDLVVLLWISIWIILLRVVNH